MDKSKSQKFIKWEFIIAFYYWSSYTKNSIEKHYFFIILNKNHVQGRSVDEIFPAFH